MPPLVCAALHYTVKLGRSFQPLAMTPLPVNIGTSLDTLTDIMENDIVCDDWNADPTLSTVCSPAVLLTSYVFAFVAAH